MTTTDPTDVARGVTEAFDFYLSQNSISIGDLIREAVHDSVDRWLDERGDSAAVAPTQFAAAPAGWRVWHASPSSTVPLTTEPLAGWAWTPEHTHPRLTPMLVVHGRVEVVGAERDIRCLGVTGPDPSDLQIQGILCAYWGVIDEVVREAADTWTTTGRPAPEDFGRASDQVLSARLVELAYGGNR